MSGGDYKRRRAYSRGSALEVIAALPPCDICGDLGEVEDGAVTYCVACWTEKEEDQDPRELNFDD